MKIHPVVWKDIIKMYEFSHDYPSINIIFQRLNIYTEEITPSNFKEILLNLDFNQGITVIEDILRDPNFWFTEEDKKNVKKSQQENSYNEYKKFFGPQYPGLHSIFHKTREDFVDNIAEPDIPKEHFWGDKLLELLQSHYEVAYENNQLFLNGIRHDQRRFVNHDLLVNREFEDLFYKHLCNEMNQIYRLGLYTSVLILNRKLFESLLIEFLEKKFPNRDGLYYDENRKRYFDLKDLIKSLRDHKKELVDRKTIIEKLLGSLENYRQKGNRGTHNKFYIPKQEDIQKLDINEVLELFIVMCESNNVSIK